MTVTSTSSTAPLPRRPVLPPSRHPSLPPHLTVTRQPSNDSQYTTIPVNTPSEEGRGNTDHGSGAQANGTRREGEEPVAIATREGAATSATPGAEDSNLDTRARPTRGKHRQPLARATAKVSTARLSPPTVLTSAPHNSNHARASPSHGSPTPPATKLEDGHVYHGLDQSKRDDSSTYTTPSHGPPKVKGKRNGLRVPSKPLHLQINTLTASGDYCNDAPSSTAQRYQALSPQTRDYISLYSTADVDQDVQSPT